MSLLSHGQPWQAHVIAKPVDRSIQDTYVGDYDLDGDVDILVRMLMDGGVPDVEFLSLENVAGDTVWVPADTTVVTANLHHPIWQRDLDLDGDLDLTDGHTMLMCNGDLSFSVVDISAWWGPEAIMDERIGLMNTNAFPDLVGSSYDDSLIIILDPWSGSPGPTLVFALPNGSVCDIDVGDIDLDGDDDVVGLFFHIDPYIDSVFHMRNLGNGVMAPPEMLEGYPHLFQTDGTDWLIGVKDMNGNAFPDIVTATIWLPNIDGTQFGTCVTPYPSAAQQFGLFWWAEAVDDVDLDGDLDIVGGMHPDGPGSDFPYWLENSGAGQFTFRTLFWTATDERFAAMSDMDGDGQNEFVRNTHASVLISHLENDTTFSEPIEALLGLSVVSDHIEADLDADGDEDVVVSDDRNGWVFTMDNQGDGTFSAPHTLAIGQPHLPQITVVDMEMDGDPDIATAFEITGRLAVFRNSGGSFAPMELLMTDSSFGRQFKASWGDLVGDALPDVFFEHYYDNLLYLCENIGGAALAPSQVMFSVPSLNKGDRQIVDIDGDGVNDLVYTPLHLPDDTLFWSRNLSAGSFAEPTMISPIDDYLAAWQQFLPHDLDLDGDLDVLSSCPVSWAENLGGGIFSPLQPLTDGYSGRAEFLGDLNGDGLVDAGAYLAFPGRIGYHPGIDTASFGPFVEIHPAANGNFLTQAIRMKDLNEDLDLDLVMDITIPDGPGLYWFGNPGLSTGTASATELDAWLQVVPNPTTGPVRLVAKEPLLNSDVIELRDAGGRLLRTFSGRGTCEALIPQGHLESGLYVLRVMRDGSSMATARMVIH